MELKDGKFMIDENDNVAKKFLAMHINDNVYKNMQRHISIALFDPELRFGKDVYSEQKFEAVVNKLLKDKQFVENMHFAVDKILMTHRNTKLFLLMMTGPFLIAMKLVWWAFKAFLIYFVFNKVGKTKNGNTITNENEGKISKIK